MRPLPVVDRASPPPAANCAFAGGCGDGPAAELPPDVAALVQDHPCYSEEAHRHFARLQEVLRGTPPPWLRKALGAPAPISEE